MERIPFVACINLIEREDRYVMIKEEFERIGIANRVHWHRPERHPQSGRIGCFESHLAVFKAALDAGAPFAVVCEDDVRFSGQWKSAFERLLALIDSGVAWNHASLQNSGAEVCLQSDEDLKLPEGIFRAAFYFTRCYAITREAMENAIKVGITKAHVDVALAVANWGKGFVVRPAAVLDVPSVSDNDWAEGGWAPWLAGQMQGVTHLPCVIADRWKTVLLPKFVEQPKLEATAWKKFMEEAGAKDHLREGYEPGAAAASIAHCPAEGSPKSWRRRMYDASTNCIPCS